MRAYRNEVWDMFGNYFTKHKIRVISRYENTVADSLVVVAGKFKTPTVGQEIIRLILGTDPPYQIIPNTGKFLKMICK